MTTIDTSPEAVADMLEGVTPAPWTAGYVRVADTFFVEPLRVVFDGPGREEDATFVAWAREAVPALSAALTQSRAETAAAYERAAGLATYTNAGLLDCDVPASFRAAIRALATPDQSAALDAVKAAALAEIAPHLQSFRKALELARIAAPEATDDTNDKAYWQHEINALDAILAAIPKGGV